jgi:CDP-diacylglycerol--glycerol-3-phosphate 3-phosphatidyltransferase
MKRKRKIITPNRLSFFRILLAAGLLLLLLWKRTMLTEVIAIAGFVLACVTDWWDGHLARTKSLSSSVGKILDPIADKLLILGLLFIFWHFKLYSGWWIVFIFLREIIVTMVRIIYLSSGKVIAAELAGKLKMGMQIASICISFAFLMVLDGGASAQWVLWLRGFHYAAIFLANVITVISGGLFFWRLSVK